MKSPSHIVFVLVSLLSRLLCPQTAHPQVTLRPWLDVFGTVDGAKLGLEVSGFTPTSNLPYRISVYDSGKTGLYALPWQNDTHPEIVVDGQNLHTGDLNSDGWTDVVVRRLDNASHIDTVVIFWGTSAGIDTDGATTLTGYPVWENFGASMCVGDLIGDSTDDLVVGTNQYPFGSLRGRVYVFEGSSSFDPTPSLVLTGDSINSLGRMLAIGDLNNDGFNDLVARGLKAGTPRFQYVDVWYGGALFDTLKDVRITSRETGEGLAIFDANGDGVDDLLWTTRDSALVDHVSVHFGGTSLDTMPSLRLNVPLTQFLACGKVIANGGDMNGDGFDDIVVGSFLHIISGNVSVYGAGPYIDGEVDAEVEEHHNSWFGWSASGIGDVNGDGLDDIIVGGPNYGFGPTTNQRGYWGIFLGSSSILVGDVEETAMVPSVINLYQSYPNPFNPRTIIRYDLSERASVRLEIYTVGGEHLRTLVDTEQSPGSHEVTLDGSQMASGTYFYRLKTQTNDGTTHTTTKRMSLVK